MFLGLCQALNSFQCIDEHLSLGGASPVCWRFSVVDVEIEDCSDQKGDEGGDPVHGEHGQQAEEDSEQRQPWRIVLE